MHGWQKRQQGRECIGHIALPTPKHLVTACDAAVTGPRVGHGFAASTGQYGLLALTRLKGRDADSVEAAELRAAYWAFRNTNKAGERPVLLLADSKTAVRYIESWRKGGTDLPDGYPTERMGHASTLAKFAAFLNRNPSRLRVQWVKGHGRARTQRVRRLTGEVSAPQQERGTRPADHREVGGKPQERDDRRRQEHTLNSTNTTGKNQDHD